MKSTPTTRVIKSSEFKSVLQRGKRVATVSPSRFTAAASDKKSTPNNTPQKTSVTSTVTPDRSPPTLVSTLPPTTLAQAMSIDDAVSTPPKA